MVWLLLLFFVARRSWGWAMWVSGLVIGAFLIVDMAFLGANATKIVGLVINKVDPVEHAKAQAKRSPAINQGQRPRTLGRAA